MIWISGPMLAGLCLTWFGLMVALGALLKGDWLDLYGLAIATLLVLPTLTLLIMQGLTARGHSAWLVMWLILPLAVGSVVQVAFWAFFFQSLQAAVSLGFARAMVLGALDPWWVWIALAWGMSAGVVLWLARP